ncbi:OsmC family peroxiredoxin [bacterium]|nr:OsmC family peroxiredoxin [bacterium]
MEVLDVLYEKDLSIRCIHRLNGAEIVTDAPKESLGRGLMFSPTDLLAAALGSCVLTLMGLAAKKLKVDITGAKAQIEKEMVSQPVRRIGKFVVTVFCSQSYREDIQEELEKAGRLCPVHNSLHPDIIQEFVFYWGVS